MPSHSLFSLAAKQMHLSNKKPTTAGAFISLLLLMCSESARGQSESTHKILWILNCATAALAEQKADSINIHKTIMTSLRHSRDAQFNSSHTQHSNYHTAAAKLHSLCMLWNSNALRYKNNFEGNASIFPRTRVKRIPHGHYSIAESGVFH
jgi:hypothetical protein